MTTWAQSSRGSDLDDYWGENVYGVTLANMTLSIASNQFVLSQTLPYVQTSYKKEIPIVSGGDYRSTFLIDYVSTTSVNPIITLGSTDNGNEYATIFIPPSTGTVGFVATGSTLYLKINLGNPNPIATVVYDNISLTGPLASDPSTTGDLISPYGDFTTYEENWVQSSVSSSPEWSDTLWNQGSILTWAIDSGGSAYNIDDIIRLTLNGNELAVATVTDGTITNGRRVTEVTFTSLGDNYLTNEVCETTTNSANGSGCRIKVLSVTNTLNSLPLSSTWAHTT